MIISDISAAYGAKTIFKDFAQDFGVNKLLLTGPSGCGKTTLLREVFKQLQTTSKNCRSVLVLQEDALLPWATALENILDFIRVNNPEINEDYIKSHKLYNLINSFGHKPAWTMSFGERRTVELFRAFVTKPEVLLLDEPFNFLDPERRQILANYLFGADLNLKKLIITTHEIECFHNADIVRYDFPSSYPIEKLTYVGKA